MEKAQNEPSIGGEVMKHYNDLAGFASALQKSFIHPELRGLVMCRLLRAAIRR